MNFLSPLAPHVHWAMRLSLAATFLYHGIGKFPIPAFSEAMAMPSCTQTGKFGDRAVPQNSWACSPQP